MKAFIISSVIIGFCFGFAFGLMALFEWLAATDIMVILEILGVALLIVAVVLVFAYIVGAVFFYYFGD